MVGLLDFFTGGDPTEMAQIDPRYGVPRSDVRDTAVSTLGNISALLLAAGQPIMPAQRAQLFAQLGGAAGQAGTDLYNAAQRRLMMSQMEQRRAEGAEVSRIGDLMKNPEAFKAATGYDLQQFGGMRAADVSQALRQIRTTQLQQDPNERALTALRLREAERNANMPTVREVNGQLLEYNDQTRRWTPITSPRPQGGLEGEAQSIILQGARNPQVADSVEYAIAFTRLYGGRTEVRNGEVVQIIPPIPPGIPRPTDRAMAAASGASGAPTPQGTGTTAPAAPTPEGTGVTATPPQPPAGAPTGGETRTVTTPSGGQVSVTTTQPRALSAAEITLRQETEGALSAAQAARGSLEEALRLNPRAYEGPGALTRANISGLSRIDAEGAQATTSFNSIMTEQALGQLRAIFGGSPTEGERKILIEMGAALSMSRPQREALLRRAMDEVDKRIQSNERRLREVARGEYGRAQPGFEPPAARPAPALPPGFEVVR